MFVVLAVATVLLLVFGLAVRFAGDDPMLNLVDYRRVRDRRALHAFAGRILLCLAAGSGVLAYLAWRRDDIAVLALLGWILWLKAGIVALAVGSSRYQQAEIDSFIKSLLFNQSIG